MRITAKDLLETVKRLVAASGVANDKDLETPLSLMTAAQTITNTIAICERLDRLIEITEKGVPCEIEDPLTLVKQQDISVAQRCRELMDEYDAKTLGTEDTERDTDV